MRYLIIFLLAIVSLNVNAQSDYNKWSIGGGFGSHDGMVPVKIETRVFQLHHFGLNSRYMFNNRFGLMLDAGYDLFDAYGSGDENIRYWRTSVQGVINLTDVLHFHSWTKRLGLHVHGGAGISHMWKAKESRLLGLGDVTPNDPLFKGVDDMLNYVIGVTPLVKLNEKISLFGDLSFIAHSRQTYDFNMYEKVTDNGFNGYMLNVTLGANYYFGKKERHADWTPTDFMVGMDKIVADSEAKIAALEAELKAVQEKNKDDDQDGVPNYADEEPETPKGNFVDSKGITILDTDGDGIPDLSDACPKDVGLIGNSGCPDTDLDGINDLEDNCPEVFGERKNKGCPAISKADLAVMDRALKGVNFKTNSSELTKASLPVLNDVSKVMKNNPDYILRIGGHTDNVGDPARNMKLSEERAQAVVAYLISKGLQKDRFIAAGYGDTEPIAPNETPEGRLKNRRVEFNIAF